jgi:hypothetical protein
MQPSSSPLQVTGMYLYHHVLISTKSLPFASSQSAQSSPSQDPPWEEKTFLCYCDRWGENMEDTICAERSPTRGMERDHRFVGNLVLLSYLQLSLLQRRGTTLSCHNMSLRENDHAR